MQFYRPLSRYEQIDVALRDALLRASMTRRRRANSVACYIHLACPMMVGQA
jgi:hypothetical protein